MSWLVDMRRATVSLRALRTPQVIRRVHNWRYGAGKIAASTEKNESLVRLGTLGAAAINPSAIFDPVAKHPDVVISGLAARSKAKTKKQIKDYCPTHARAYASYDASCSRIRTLKPSTSLFPKACTSTGPNALQWLIESGDYGAVQEVKARRAVPTGAIWKNNIRFQHVLADGICTDIIYVLSVTSYFTLPPLSGAVVSVTNAQPRIKCRDLNIDDAMTADYTLTSPNGTHTVRCHIEVDSKAPWLWGIIPPFWELQPYVEIELEHATIFLFNFSEPWFDHTIMVMEHQTGKYTKHQALVDGP
ncbi:hypothetical protein LTR56_022992 [Elasticomyces elasticus]|nr:hypothetical protein LTR56_022992 [Elasticomyces elasticus]KAK4907388.1 hypothetical protein LTR49_023571 [Elasticomyces elasticus]